MGTHPESSNTKVYNRIHRRGRGWAFTADDFEDLGAPDAITSALKRHAKNGSIRRLTRGLYDYPVQHPTLGNLAPNPDAVAKAIAGRTARIQPAGAYAANLLGLSEQVPMKIVYLTDGASKTVRIGNQQITLKTTTPKNMATAGRTSGLVIQALRHLGNGHVDDTVISQLRQKLSDDDKKRLLKDVPLAPAWIAKIMRLVAR